MPVIASFPVEIQTEDPSFDCMIILTPVPTFTVALAPQHLGDNDAGGSWARKESKVGLPRPSSATKVVRRGDVLAMSARSSDTSENSGSISGGSVKRKAHK